MKKILALVLVICMFLLLVACATSSPDESESLVKTQDSEYQYTNNIFDNNTVQNGNNSADMNINNGSDNDNDDDFIVDMNMSKITGVITTASAFSEGKAFVTVDGDKNTTYCIDKNGYILFSVDENLGAFFDRIYACFNNGYAFIAGGICDESGNITYPEDVGVNNFYGVALNGGYIIAEKITANYSTTKRELGIMNTEFEWVLELSESLYDILGGCLEETLYINTQSYFSDGFIYFDEEKYYLDISTGEVSKNVPEVLENKVLIYYTDATYRNQNEEIVIDLSAYTTIQYGTRFVNDKAVIVFYNNSADKYYYTVIDRGGTFLFEPVEIDLNSVYAAETEFDGEYVLFGNQMLNAQKFVCYDLNGKLIGKKDMSNFGSTNINMVYSADTISDGVIVVCGIYNFSYDVHYVKPDFTDLF